MTILQKRDKKSQIAVISSQNQRGAEKAEEYFKTNLVQLADDSETVNDSRTIRRDRDGETLQKQH